MQEAKATGTRTKPAVMAGKAAPSPGQQQASQHYQAALQLMQQGKYEKAMAGFEKLLTAASPPEFADRARIYIAACQRMARQAERTFETPGEQFDYAISLLNTGLYDEAREQFLAITGKNDDADYAFYGLAVLSSMTGQAETCLNALARAIELNAHNRIQARVDSDFQDMADDPRFTELLYPEV
jgi:tetratricopeptide (TPR) repeat protein